MPLEIETRLGGTLLDIAQVDGDFTLAGVVLVHDGQLVVAPVGRVGLVDYTATPIARPARDLPYARPRDWRWLPYVAAALLLHVGLWAVATTTRPPTERPPPREARRPVKVTRVVAAPVRADAPPDDRARDRVADTKSQGQARAMQGPRGAAGARTRSERGHVAVKNTGEEAQLTKAEAVARARTAGVLGQAEVLLESYATLGGSERLTSAFDAIDVTAPLAGGDGTAGGQFGLAASGGGAGGGGTMYGTIGTGTTGTFSTGTTHGHGWGGSHQPAMVDWRTWDGGHYEYSPLPMRRLRVGNRVTICPPSAEPCTIDGDLDSSVLRRYVKRNIMKLSYCYEKQVLARPALRTGGVVTLSFGITAQGRIRVARATGFDAEVSACVREVFEAIQLPSGDALVEYALGFAMPS